MPRVVKPYGSWASPISAATVAEAGIGLRALRHAGDDLLWVESRPLEGGRNVAVRPTAGGGVEVVTPEGFDVRTQVHEYGGGDVWAVGAAVVFANRADQRLYRQEPGAEPVPITPEPPAPRAHRFADGTVVGGGATIVCVRERHEEGSVVNELVALPADGSGPPRTTVSGRDFYAFPRVSPDGRRLAWLEWDHPNMPWDGTELWVGDVDERGAVTGVQRVAGGARDSIYAPQWSPGGVLHFVSDRTGWWNLYRVAGGDIAPLLEMPAEFGAPQWIFGTSTYGFADEDRLVCIYGERGLQRLGVLEARSGSLEPLDLPYTAFPGPFLSVGGRRAAAIAASATEAPAVVEIDLATRRAEVLRRSLDVEIDAATISVPEPIEFATDGGERAHALFYPPTSADHAGPEDERPPLLVMSHGGPTGAARAWLDLEKQFWTSRGIAVVDVNYRGSTGYGRGYRDALRDRWGVADVEDCVHAARHLAETGRVDGTRLAIRGGSAGGYTTLRALTATDVFAAGASYYGVADLEALALETHKFESRYLDGLIGPYPEAVQRYRERSPIHHARRLSTPVILFQGLDDAVVPPAQAEAMVEALRAKGIPFAYLAFEGEDHGFRRAETVRRCLEAELDFYGRIFGFGPADEIEPAPIEGELGR